MDTKTRSNTISTIVSAMPVGIVCAIVLAAAWGADRVDERRKVECQDLSAGNQFVRERARFWSESHGFTGTTECAWLKACRTEDTVCFVHASEGSTPTALTCNVKGCVEWRP